MALRLVRPDTWIPVVGICWKGLVRSALQVGCEVQSVLGLNRKGREAVKGEIWDDLFMTTNRPDKESP